MTYTDFDDDDDGGLTVSQIQLLAHRKWARSVSYKIRSLQASTTRDMHYWRRRAVKAQRQAQHMYESARIALDGDRS